MAPREYGLHLRHLDRTRAAPHRTRAEQCQTEETERERESERAPRGWKKGEEEREREKRKREKMKESNLVRKQVSK